MSEDDKLLEQVRERCGARMAAYARKALGAHRSKGSHAPMDFQSLYVLASDAYLQARAVAFDHVAATVCSTPSIPPITEHS